MSSLEVLERPIEVAQLDELLRPAREIVVLGLCGQLAQTAMPEAYATVQPLCDRRIFDYQHRFKNVVLGEFDTGFTVEEKIDIAVSKLQSEAGKRLSFYQAILGEDSDDLPKVEDDLTITEFYSPKVLKENCKITLDHIPESNPDEIVPSFAAVSLCYQLVREEATLAKVAASRKPLPLLKRLTGWLALSAG